MVAAIIRMSCGALGVSRKKGQAVIMLSATWHCCRVDPLGKIAIVFGAEWKMEDADGVGLTHA